MTFQEFLKCKGINVPERRVHFRGHEGISFWYAIDPLYELKRLGVINESEMNEILKIISLHGVLFNRIKDGKEFKPEKIVGAFGSVQEFNRYVKQVRNDSLGRFYFSKGDRADVGKLLGDTLYGENVFYENKFIPEIKDDSPTLDILVGLPACGKSTYTKEHYFEAGEEVTVISRDNVIMEMGEKLGMSNYTDIYKALTDEQHKEAYEETIRRFNEAVKRGDNIVIDMTNMSKKSRNKWLHQTRRKYKTRAVVFIAGKSLLEARNILRTEQENKFIPQYVFTNMKKSFIVPTTLEVDEVEYVHQDQEINK